MICITCFVLISDRKPDISSDSGGREALSAGPGLEVAGVKSDLTVAGVIRMLAAIGGAKISL